MQLVRMGALANLASSQAYLCITRCSAELEAAASKQAVNEVCLILCRRPTFGKVTSARIRTYGCHAFCSGDLYPTIRVEARIKVPQGERLKCLR